LQLFKTTFHSLSSIVYFIN